ncbi:MAG: SRPBCC family protein [Pseudomonadota bacterium]
MDKAQRLDEQTVRFVRVFQASPEQVWAYLVDGDKRSKWLCGGDWELKAGGRAPMVFDNPALSDSDDLPPARYTEETGEVIHEGSIKEIDAPQRLVLLWVEHDGTRSEVSFELAGGSTQTTLTLTHRKLSNEDMLTGVCAGWHAHLDIYLAVMERRTPPSFWSRFNALAENVYHHRIDGEV